MRNICKGKSVCKRDRHKNIPVLVIKTNSTVNTDKLFVEEKKVAHSDTKSPQCPTIRYKLINTSKERHTRTEE